MSGAGTYVLRNNQPGTVDITDADGNLRSIAAGSSVTVALSGAGYAQALGLFGAAGVLQSNATAPTFLYCLGAVAPVATPTDVLVIQGSSSKTINVSRIRLSGAATAQGAMLVQLVRRSAADVGGATLTPIVPGLADIGAPTPTAVIGIVSGANFTTLGAANGTLGAQRVGMAPLGTGATGDGQAVEWLFGTNDQPVRLRGTSDFLCVNLAGAAVPAGGVLDFEVELWEDNS